MPSIETQSVERSGVEVVRAIYDAFAAGDVAAVVALMAPDIVWIEAENHPYADRNPYCGPEQVVSGLFSRLATEWDGFAAVPEETFDAGDKVIVLGRYRGTFKATGRAIDAQMVHVWRVADGKARHFQQYADTLQFARATGAG